MCIGVAGNLLWWAKSERLSGDPQRGHFSSFVSKQAPSILQANPGCR
jgi:hypothetical protein